MNEVAILNFPYSETGRVFAAREGKESLGLPKFIHEAVIVNCFMNIYWLKNWILPTILIVAAMNLDHCDVYCYCTTFAIYLLPRLSAGERIFYIFICNP
jgi:hypothetical protein